MIRLVLATSVVLLSLPATAAAAGYDGAWTGILRTETGLACENSYGVRAEIAGGRVTGKLTSPTYDGALTGTVTEAGTLQNLEAGGDVVFRLEGRARGGEINGTWTADSGAAGTCRGGFVLFRETTPRRLQTGQAAKPGGNEPEQPAARSEQPVARGEDFPKGYYIQLASLKSPNSAKGAWADLQKRLPDLLGNLALSLQSADLGDRGIYYRVRVGPLPNLATAEDLCWQIKAEKLDCVVVRRR